MLCWDPMGGSLIFVVSQPRAGSTLLQKTLGSHPDIFTMSEPWIALHPLFGRRTSGIAADYHARLSLSAVEHFLAQLPEGEEAWWEAVRRMLGYLYERALAPSGKRFFLDKTPRYYFVVPELRRTFPRARFVFLLRNPLAVLASIVDTWAADDSVEDLRLFRHDLAVAPRLLVDALASLGPQDCVVRYEELTANPEPVIARLCEALGIAFDPAMVQYGASQAGRAWFEFGDRETVYREDRPVADRIGRWQITLASPIRRAWAGGYLRSIGAEVFGALGYPYEEMERRFPPEPGFEGAWAEIVRPGGASRSAGA
jgi:hypothetical protein